MMKEDFLEKIDRELLRTIETFLRTHDVSELMFESVICSLYGRSSSSLSARVVTKILLDFELKLVCDLVTASQSDDYGVATFSTYRLFNRMLRHLYDASDYTSVFDLNISNLSHLSKTKISIEDIIDILLEFAVPKVGDKPATAAKIDHQKPIVTRDYVNVLRFPDIQTDEKRLEGAAYAQFPIDYIFSSAAYVGSLNGKDLVEEKETNENVIRYLGAEPLTGDKAPDAEKEKSAKQSGDSSGR